jgi:alpha-1,2-mannosyltransferase
VAVFAATTLIGFIVLPHESIEFWKLILVEQDTRTGAAYYLSNQSVLGGMVRMFGDTGRMHLLGLVIGALVGLLAAIAGAAWTRRGEELFGVGLVGLGTLMASPLSWTHHFVWVVPIGIALFRYGLPRSVKIVGGAFSVWTTAGLILQWLPYAQGQELTYSFFEDLVSDITPILSVATIILAALTVRHHRPVDAGASAATGRVEERHLLPEPAH